METEPSSRAIKTKPRMREGAMLPPVRLLGRMLVATARSEARRGRRATGCGCGWEIAAPPRGAAVRVVPRFSRIHAPQVLVVPCDLLERACRRDPRAIGVCWSA